MPNYDFNMLQPAEFEELSRDLLQKQHGVFVESFTDGRDGGIDLRFAKDGKANIIVQAKRYKDWNSLKGVLTKEKNKLAKLNPARYILTTSVGLTPDNKATIVGMLSPYITSTEDILGRDDLNNLIGLFPEVENRHNKLWLASTNVLENILSSVKNSATLNWTAFELEEIRQEIATYVMNPSFDKARRMLEEYGVVIISGIPGIGKTTLARLLIYYFLNRASAPGAPKDIKNFDQLVYITDTMDAASALYKPGERQIFFFDDFLGDVTFDKKGGEFDNKLVKFMRAVKRDKDNKLFILATREHILSEARLVYKNLNMEEYDIPKCVVQLSDYTSIIRARILYNHLSVANLPDEYIDEFLKDKGYHRLVEHVNFNPRIIEMFIRRNQWRHHSSSSFMNKFKEVFDNPEAVWEMAFENLNEFAQYALLVLVAMGTEIDMEDWKKAFIAFCRNTYDTSGLVFSEKEWRNTMKILHECFIKTSLIGRDKLVTAYSPSVRDFLIGYLRKSPENVIRILSAAIYTEQLHTIFRDGDSNGAGNTVVLLTDKDIQTVVASLERIAMGGWASCKIIDQKPQEFKRRPDKYHQMEELSSHLYSRQFITSGVVERIFTDMDLMEEEVPVRLRLSIAEIMNWSGRESQLAEVFSSIYDEIIDVEGYSELRKALVALGRWLPKELIKDDDELIGGLVDAVYEDMSTSISSYADLEMREGIYYEVFSEFGFSSLPDDISDSIDSLRAEMEEAFDEDDYYEWTREMNSYEDRHLTVREKIDNLMASLRK